MDKSPAENPSQKEDTQPQSSRPRVKKIPVTPRPEVATPSTPQTTVLPSDAATPQHTETFVSESYLQIIKDLMGKFSPTGRISDLLTHMADEFKKEEAVPSPIPLEIPTNPTTLTETPAAQPLIEQTTSLIPSPTRDPNNQDNEEEEREAEVEGAEEGNSQAEEIFGGKSEEVD